MMTLQAMHEISISIRETSLERLNSNLDAGMSLKEIDEFFPKRPE
jgi:hypothetical protein